LPTVEYHVVLQSVYYWYTNNTSWWADTDGRVCALIDTSKFVNPKFYFEVVIRIDTAAGTAYARLLDMGTSDVVQGGTEVSGSVISTQSTTFIRLRSGELALTSGNRYRIEIKSSGAAYGVLLDAAKIIVEDDISGGWTKGEESVSHTSNTWYTPTTGDVWDTVMDPEIYKHETSPRDGTLATYFEACLACSKANTTVRARLIEHSNPDLSDTGTVVTGSQVNVTPASADIPVRARSGAITLQDGKYYAVQITCATANKTVTVTGNVIIIQQSGTITKTQLHRRVAFWQDGTSSTEYEPRWKYTYLDRSKLPPIATFYFETSALVSSGGQGDARLYNKDDGTGVSGSAIDETSTTCYFRRSGSISLTDLKQYDAQIRTHNASYTYTCSAAYLVINAQLAVAVYKLVENLSILRDSLSRRAIARRTFSEDLSALRHVFSQLYTELIFDYKFIQNLSAITDVFSFSPRRWFGTFRENLSAMTDIFSLSMLHANFPYKFTQSLHIFARHSRVVAYDRRISAAGMKEVSEKTTSLIRANSRVGIFYAAQKCIRKLGDGSLMAVVEDRGNYYGYLMRSEDGGKTWSEVANTGETMGVDCNYEADVDGSGNVYVVWSTAAGAYVYLIKFTRSGSTWSRGSRETVAGSDSVWPNKRGGPVDIWVAPNGVAFVAYQNYYDAAAGIRRRNADGTYETAVKVYDGGSNVDAVVRICGYRANDGTNRIVLSVRTGSGAATAYYSTNMGVNWNLIGALGVEPETCAMGSGYKEAFVYISAGNVMIKVKDSPYTTYTVDDSGQCNHSSCSVYGNTIRVTYRYNGLNSNGDIAYKVSTDFGQTWGERVVLTNDATVDDWPVLDYDGDAINIAWERGNDVYCLSIYTLVQAGMIYVQDTHRRAMAMSRRLKQDLSGISHVFSSAFPLKVWKFVEALIIQSISSRRTSHTRKASETTLVRDAIKFAYTPFRVAVAAEFYLRKAKRFVLSRVRKQRGKAEFDLT